MSRDRSLSFIHRSKMQNFTKDEINSAMFEPSKELAHILLPTPHKTTKHQINAEFLKKIGEAKYLTSHSARQEYANETISYERSINETATVPRILQDKHNEQNNYGKILTAIYSRNPELLERLLETKSYNVSKLSQLINVGQVATKSSEISVILIKHGADVNVNVHKQEPLLAYAIANSKLTIIDALLDRDDLDLNQVIVAQSEKISSYTTLLAYAVEKQDFVTAIKILEKPSLNVTAPQVIYKNGQHNVKCLNILEVAINSNNLMLLNKVLEHELINDSLVKETVDLSKVILVSQEMAYSLIKHGANCNVNIATEFRQEQSLLSYAIKCDNKELISAILSSKDFDFSSGGLLNNPAKLAYQYLTDKEFLEIVSDNNLASKILHNAAKMSWDLQLKEFIKMFKTLDSDVINCSDENEFGLAQYLLYSPSLLLWLVENGYKPHKSDEFIPLKLAELAVEEGNVEELFLLLSIISKTDVNDLPIFNINLKDESNQRLIDKVLIFFANKNSAIEVANLNNIITELRHLGSVEPRNLISTAEANKLDFTNDRLDSYYPNQVNVVKILHFLYKKVPLSEIEIDAEIDAFKLKDFSGWVNDVWYIGLPLTIPQVVDMICIRRDVHDRLSENWDFKKVLASVIHIVRTTDDEMMLNSLKHFLSQAYLCDLGKLMNLLGVVQDHILAETNYDVYEFEDFAPILEPTIAEIERAFPDKAETALVTWFYDRYSKVLPEQWSPYTIRVQAIFQNEFDKMDNTKTIDSYHFLSGLTNKIINPLIERIKIGSLETEMLSKWQILLQKGIELQVKSFFTQIQNSSEEDNIENFFENICYESKTMFGDFSTINWSVIEPYYTAISNIDEQKATEFLRLLTMNCDLNRDTQTTLLAVIVKNKGLKTVYTNESEDEMLMSESDEDSSAVHLEGGTLPLEEI